MAVQIRKRAEGEGKNAGEYAAATDFDGKVVAKGPIRRDSLGSHGRLCYRW